MSTVKHVEDFEGPRQKEDAKSEGDQVYWTCQGYQGGDAGQAPGGELETSGFLVNQRINYMTNDSTPSNEIVLETWALPNSLFSWLWWPM